MNKGIEAFAAEILERCYMNGPSAAAAREEVVDVQQ